MPSYRKATLRVIVAARRAAAELLAAHPVDGRASRASQAIENLATLLEQQEALQSVRDAQVAALLDSTALVEDAGRSTESNPRGADESAVVGQAMAMAQLLLDIEWSLIEIRPKGKLFICPACANYREHGHAEGCELVVLLRAAGLMPSSEGR